MAKITVLGGSGFSGGWIAREAAARGHEVTTLSRTAPVDLPEGVTVLRGSVLEPADVEAATVGADVVVGALSPRGDMVGKVQPAYAQLAAQVAETGQRLIIVGGFGSLKNPGGERIVDTDAFAPEYKPEALELAATLDALRATDGLDWTYVSPASEFGSYIPVQTRRGEYRVGDETPMLDEQGSSAISGPDFAMAVVDEIEAGAHRGEHISFAY